MLLHSDCLGEGPDTSGGCLTHQMLAASNSIASPGPKPISQTFVPCIDIKPVRNYLNQASVLSALHISNSSFAWDVCSSHISYVQYAPTMLTVYPQLISAGLRITIYSGDTDSCVPYLGTERCVAKLGLQIVNDWHPWYIKKGGYTQTAGYAITYAHVRDEQTLLLVRWKLNNSLLLLWPINSKEFWIRDGQSRRTHGANLQASWGAFNAYPVFKQRPFVTIKDVLWIKEDKLTNYNTCLVHWSAQSVKSAFLRPFQGR